MTVLKWTKEIPRSTFFASQMANRYIWAGTDWFEGKGGCCGSVARHLPSGCSPSSVHSIGHHRGSFDLTLCIHLSVLSKVLCTFCLPFSLSLSSCSVCGWERGSTTCVWLSATHILTWPDCQISLKLAIGSNFKGRAVTLIDRQYHGALRSLGGETKALSAFGPIPFSRTGFQIQMCVFTCFLMPLLNLSSAASDSFQTGQIFLGVLFLFSGPYLSVDLCCYSNKKVFSFC